MVQLLELLVRFPVEIKSKICYSNGVKIVLQGERPPSWNKIYQSRHWIFRKNLADSVHKRVVIALNILGLRPMNKDHIFNNRVDIIITAYFDKRPLDSDNIGAKLYIDPLKFVLLHDDSPKYVRSTKTISEIDRDNPRLEIEIIPVDKESIK